MFAMARRGISYLYIRNAIFGIEDSLVSTVGFLSGIAVADLERATILLVGVVLIVVEGVSMGAGAFLSEASAEEYRAAGARRKHGHAFAAGVVMFVSYLLAGFVPLMPYILFPISVALEVSVGSSLVALILLGAASGALSRASLVKSAVRMLVIGGVAIAIGVTVATFIATV